MDMKMTYSYTSNENVTDFSKSGYAIGPHPASTVVGNGKTPPTETMGIVTCEN